MARILIDVTRMLQGGQHTGIQRVLRRLYAGLLKQAEREGWRTLPVCFAGGDWFCWSALPAHPLEGSRPDRQPTTMPLQVRSGDHLLLADASWYLDPWPAVDAALDRGARLIGMVHDLLPVRHPEWFSGALQPRFAAHLRALMRRAGLILVPSRQVEQDLLHWAGSLPGGPPVRLLPHGADTCDASATTERQPLECEPSLGAAAARPFFLCAGTLEPRKNHETILDACDAYWAAGGDASLFLVGARGWGVSRLHQRLRSHPRRGAELFVFDSVADPVLNWLYRRARALLYLSLAEGFGLPVLEAAYLGCPVIAADIPPLREAGGAWPVYIPPRDRDRLLAQLNNPESGNDPAARPQRTWRQVATELLTLLEGQGITGQLASG